MGYKDKVLIFTLLIILLIVNLCLAQSNVNNEKLKGFPESIVGVEQLPVIIKLKAQIDIDYLLSLVKNVSRSDAKIIVWEEVNEFAHDSQEDLLKYLRNYEIKNGINLNIRSLKIVNSISVSAPPDLVSRLSQREEINFIIYSNNPAIFEDMNKTNPPFDEMDEIAWGVEHVHAPEVWEMGYTGEGILVAIIDSGIKYDHPDLVNNMWDGGTEYPNHGWNFNQNNNDPMDQAGHGTGVAGIVAGDGSGGNQTGIAPGATLMALEVGNPADVMLAHDFALEHGADITTMSMGFSPSTNEERAIWRNSFDVLNSAGIISIKSAGNRREDFSAPTCITIPGGVPSPWRHPDEVEEGGRGGLISVAAITPENEYAYFSSFGPVTWQDVDGYNDYLYDDDHIGMIAPDISAPGVDGLTLNLEDGYRYDFGGTSMAAPHIAGAMALMLSKDSNLTTITLDSILQSTALDLGVLGKDNDYGSGLVQADMAVQAINATTGLLAGIVYDFNTNEPLEGVTVRQRFTNIIATTNSDGEYSLELLTGSQQITIDHFPYAHYENSVLIDSIIPVQLDIGLTVGLLEASRERIDITLEENSTADRYLWIYNRGSENMDVELSAYPVIETDELFDLMFEFNVNESLGDHDLHGISYIDSLIYICGSNNNQNPNKVYVFNLEGELIETFDQPGNYSTNGWYDITYDGNNIYGCENDQIVTVDKNTFEETGRFVGPFYPISSITYDSENNCLWVSNISQNIVALNPLSGEIITQIEEDIRVKTIQYVENDEDNLPLYLHAEEINGSHVTEYLAKTNYTGSEFVEIIRLDGFEDDHFYDFEVITAYQNYFDVFMSLEFENNEFVVRGREKSVNLGWLNINPETFNVTFQDSQQIHLHFSSFNFIEELASGVIVARNTGLSLEDYLEVTLNIIENSTAENQLGIPEEWHLLSPYPNPFNSRTTVSFNLPQNDNVKIILYDILGREVAKIAENLYSAGKHTVQVEAKNQASGIYFLSLESGAGFKAMKKIVLIK